MDEYLATCSLCDWQYVGDAEDADARLNLHLETHSAKGTGDVVDIDGVDDVDRIRIVDLDDFDWADVGDNAKVTAMFIYSETQRRLRTWGGIRILLRPPWWRLIRRWRWDRYGDPLLLFAEEGGVPIDIHGLTFSWAEDGTLLVVVDE